MVADRGGAGAPIKDDNRSLAATTPPAFTAVPVAAVPVAVAETVAAAVMDEFLGGVVVLAVVEPTPGAARLPAARARGGGEVGRGAVAAAAAAARACTAALVRRESATSFSITCSSATNNYIVAVYQVRVQGCSATSVTHAPKRHTLV